MVAGSSNRREKKFFFFRLIFLIFPLILLSFLEPFSTNAQIQPDPSRSFNQGSVIQLPGTTSYIGDLSEEIETSQNYYLLHSVAGLLAFQVGWTNLGSPNQVGLRRISPGVIFEGIPYPILNSDLLKWLAMFGSVETLDFPASAWWGPLATGGAVVIPMPDYSPKFKNGFGFWCGSGDLLNGNAKVMDDRFLLSGNYQYWGPESMESGCLVTRGVWGQNESFQGESGILATQWLNQDYWYSTFTRIKILSPNFQSLEMKPFFQITQSNGQTIQEVGSQLNYDFNMAGLADSHIGVGYSHDDLASPSSTRDAGYVQTTDFVDVLGIFSLDLALRYDFSNLGSSRFSDLFGLQYQSGIVTFLGDYSKGQDVLDSGDAQQVDLGLRLQPDSEVNLTLKFLRQEVMMNIWNGGKCEILFGNRHFSFWVLKKINFMFGTQLLFDENGSSFSDMGGKVEFSLFVGNQFWFNGRVGANQPFYSALGGDYAVSANLRLFLEVANLDNAPTSWPDPEAASGRIFRGGIDCTF